MDLRPYEAEYAYIVAEDMPASSAAELYILPAAFEEIKSHIGWRAPNAENRYEQGGILIGDVFKDPETFIVYGLVRSVIPSPRSGDETYIQFTQESWLEMYKALDRKKAETPDGGQMRILGWYHTHPNMRVVMSQVDRNTHRRFFSKYWQFSAILNPQRGIWSVFNGADCLNCRGALFCSHEDKEKMPYESMTVFPAQNDFWHYFPQDAANRAGNDTNRVGGDTGRAGNDTNRTESGTRIKTFHQISKFQIVKPPSPPLQPSPQSADYLAAHRPKVPPGRRSEPNLPRANVLKNVGNAAQNVTDAAQTPTNAAQSVTDAAQTPANAAQSVTNVTQNVTNAAQSVTDAAQSVTDVAQPPTNAAQSAVNAAQSVANAAKNAAQSAVNAAQKALETLTSPEPYTYSRRLYQPSTERMALVRRELVEQLLYKADLPNYITEKNELILLYPLKYTGNYHTLDGENYYTFENRDGINLKATGFWYMTDSGQYVEYLERGQPSDCVNLAVVYSNRPADGNKLRDWHDVSNICDCALWLNLRNKNQTPFYALPKRYISSPFSSRFPHVPECGVVQYSERITREGRLSSRDRSGWIGFDDSTDADANAFKIRSDSLQRLFEQLKCLQMRSDCCVAVTYRADFDPTDKKAMFLPDEPFLTLRVLSPRLGSVDVDANFYNTPYPDNERDGTPKFVFLFSGGEIDVEEMKKRLAGRHSALVLNVEDAQRFRLCRLFPNA